MNSEVVITLTETFEGHAQQTESGVEFWLAWDLQNLDGYKVWRSCTAVVDKAKIACEVARHQVQYHFVDGNKMVDKFIVW